VVVDDERHHPHFPFSLAQVLAVNSHPRSGGLRVHEQTTYDDDCDCDYDHDQLPSPSRVSLTIPLRSPALAGGRKGRVVRGGDAFSVSRRSEKINLK
jgi:hypothetical protein